MAYIYLPSEYINNCNEVHNGFIRSYIDSTHTDYVDIFIKQDYMLQSGTNSDPSSVVCDTLNVYSTDSTYKLGHDYTDFFVLGLGLIFALFLFEIRRFAKYEFA